MTQHQGLRMTESDRFKLLRGPYKTPRFRYGQSVFCEHRGYVAIAGLRDLPIPWPTCRVGKRSRALILFADLARAVRRESAQAVALAWGVGLFSVWLWLGSAWV